MALGRTEAAPQPQPFAPRPPTPAMTTAQIPFTRPTQIDTVKERRNTFNTFNNRFGKQRGTQLQTQTPAATAAQIPFTRPTQIDAAEERRNTFNTFNNRFGRQRWNQLQNRPLFISIVLYTLLATNPTSNTSCACPPSNYAGALRRLRPRLQASPHPHAQLPPSASLLPLPKIQPRPHPSSRTVVECCRNYELHRRRLQLLQPLPQHRSNNTCTAPPQTSHVAFIQHRYLIPLQPTLICRSHTQYISPDTPYNAFQHTTHNISTYIGQPPIQQPISIPTQHSPQQCPHTENSYNHHCVILRTCPHHCRPLAPHQRHLTLSSTAPSPFSHTSSPHRPQKSYLTTPSTLHTDIPPQTPYTHSTDPNTLIPLTNPTLNQTTLLPLHIHLTHYSPTSHPPPHPTSLYNPTAPNPHFPKQLTTTVTSFRSTVPPRAARTTAPHRTDLITLNSSNVPLRTARPVQPIAAISTVSPAFPDSCTASHRTASHNYRPSTPAQPSPIEPQPSTTTFTRRHTNLFNPPTQTLTVTYLFYPAHNLSHTQTSPSPPALHSPHSNSPSASTLQSPPVHTHSTAPLSRNPLLTYSPHFLSASHSLLPHPPTSTLRSRTLVSICHNSCTTTRHTDTASATQQPLLPHRTSVASSTLLRLSADHRHATSHHTAFQAPPNPQQLSHVQLHHTTPTVPTFQRHNTHHQGLTPTHTTERPDTTDGPSSIGARTPSYSRTRADMTSHNLEPPIGMDDQNMLFRQQVHAQPPLTSNSHPRSSQHQLDIDEDLDMDV